jgi:RES domain-containing protein
MDGKGALKHGGRWNPPEGFRTVYLALSPEAAIAEVFQIGNHFGFNQTSLRPRLIVAVRIRLQRIVDLRPDAGPISAVCSLAELLGENWRTAVDHGRMTLSQTLGSLLFTSGVEGFLVPSATGCGPGNLIFFNENKETGSTLEVLGGDELDQALGHYGGA